MEISSEVISISKIRDGIFIGDMRAGINLDLLMQFKISHVINATGMKLPYTFESIGIKYLTIEWSENPPEETSVINNEIVSKIISFVDDAHNNGEGLFGFSFHGKNRICVVIILYIMTKFRWPLKKCFEYVKKKKADIDINVYFKNQLTEYEKNLFSNNNIHLVQPTLFWNIDDLDDKDELLMRNTYMNEVENYKKKVSLEEKVKNNRHVVWGDNKKYSKQMDQPGLIHYNIDKDLFWKKNIEDITDHINNKPLRSCIKNSLNLTSIYSSNIRKKKIKTKIYLAADGNTNNNSNKNSISKINNLNDSPQEENTIMTQRSNNNYNINNYNYNENKNIKSNYNKKKNIFDKVLGTKTKDTNKDIEESKEEDDNDKNIQIIQNDEDEDEKEIKNKDTEKNENNMNKNFIEAKNVGEHVDDDEIKYSVINIDNKEINENKNIEDNIKEEKDIKNIVKNHKDFNINITNLEPQKITNDDLKPILNNLLKIDPNLQTLKKYLKSTKKKKAFVNFSNTLPNFKISNANKKKIINNNINMNSINNNKNANINTITETINTPTINTISNNADNNNNINLIPIKLNNTFNETNKILKNKLKEEKKTNELYLLNLNVNIDNRNTFNIKSNIINNTNTNNVFKKKVNNFFMDANGNNYFNSFNKFKNRRSNTSAKKDNINNHKFFPQNINYYLGKQPSYNINEEEKKENIIIPNIMLNHNSHSTNNPRNSSKNDKNKLFIRTNINIDRNNINNMINNNKNNLINNISNTNTFNRKESKFIYLFKLFFIYI